MLDVADYSPPESSNWQGRTDLPANSCLYQTIALVDLRKPLAAATTLSFALIGFCCDEGIRRNQGRVGAKEGPEQLRQVLAKFPMPRPDITIVDAGDIICEDQNLEQAQGALARAIYLLLQHHYIPIVIGGGHELAWGHFQGLVQENHKPVSIINFDAHFDMRPLLTNIQGTSGTPFLQIAKACEERNMVFNYYCLGIQKAGNIPLLFSTAKDYDVKICYADELQLEKNLASQFIDTLIQNNSQLYTSICLDVFAAPYAPGVSAPQALGVTPWAIIPLIRQLAASKKVISYDIAELSPRYDIDQRTVKLAANLVFEILAHHAS